MQKTNKLIYLGFAIHIAITLLIGLDEEILMLIMLVPLLANVVGLFFLSFTNKIKLGAKIFMISSFLYVPIGMVGIVGCRQVLDGIKEKEFFKKTEDEKGV